MARKTIILFVALALVTVSAVALKAQEIAEILFSPIAVDITQQVPTEVTVTVPLEDGDTYTTTVPLTFTVALRVEVTGPNVADLTVEEVEPEIETSALSLGATATASGDLNQTDNNGLPYTVEGEDGLEVVQVRSDTDFAGDFELVGEIVNNSDDDFDFPEINVTLYGHDGGILDNPRTFPDTLPLKSGRTSAFNIITSVEFDAVGSYRIQVQP